MGPLHSSGSTKMDSSLESTLITLAQQILCVWGCICPEDSKRSSHSLRSKRLSLELTSVSLGVQTQGGNNIHKKNCQKFSLSRTKLVPYDPTRKTTATATTTPPDTDADLEWLEYEREKAAAEEEFIQRGPTHLLEAVYCDPCKAKVMDRGNKYSCLIPRFSAIT